MLQAKDTKKSKDKAKDRLLEDRPSQGQGQKCSRPRTQGARALQRKKRSSKLFSSDLKKKNLRKFFAKCLAFFNKILTIQNIMLFSAEDRAILEDLRFRGQGQKLQNVSSRTRTSSRTPPLHEILKRKILGHSSRITPWDT